MTIHHESPCLDTVTGELERQVLKGVSRSFYLTLRLLPGPMRRSASLGYLLARTSDTLADTAAIPVDQRLAALDSFTRAVAGTGEIPVWEAGLVNAVTDPRERKLLGATAELLDWLGNTPPGEAALVRDVLETIISGQVLDLQRFAGASRDDPVALEDGDALEDYTWRVAG
ncbi:MAG: farnesyl-diphosphate farnesyltransferase, partial [Verrucomicrobiaceae bacterium]